MDTRLWVRLALVAAAFSMPGVPAAFAEDDCKSTVNAEGQPAALRDLGAYPSSLLVWRKVVREKYGSEYNSWRYAKDRDVKCDQQKDGQWVCKRSARPCKDVLHKAIDSALKKYTCKDDAFSSYGRRKKNEKEATKDAIANWEYDVKKKFGKEWSVWEHASEKDFDCGKNSRGVRCVAAATPCMPK
jgi:hypothetical protein